MTRQVDIVIVTALEEEREAVLRKLLRHRRQNPSDDDIHIYYTANLAVKFPNGTTGAYRAAQPALLRHFHTCLVLRTGWRPPAARARRRRPAAACDASSGHSRAKDCSG